MTAFEFFSNHGHEVEFFHGLKASERNLILGAAKPRRFRAGSEITHQGDPADEFMLLCNGRARHFLETPDGKRLILFWITAGNIFAGAALSTRPTTYMVGTEAVKDSVVFVWERTRIQALARRFPLLLENAFRIGTGYFSWYIAAHAALVSMTAPERLAKVIYGLTCSIGEKVADGILLDVTNEELANCASITPSTTSRLISEWQRTGVIRKRRGAILIRFPDKFLLRVA